MLIWRSCPQYWPARAAPSLSRTDAPPVMLLSCGVPGVLGRGDRGYYHEDHEVHKVARRWIHDKRRTRRMVGEEHGDKCPDPGIECERSANLVNYARKTGNIGPCISHALCKWAAGWDSEVT